MKRLIVLMLTVILLGVGTSYAELGIDLSDLSPEELQQLISAAETQLQLNNETMLQSAIQVLTEHWKNAVYAVSVPEVSDGYLEILSAQATFIKRDFATQAANASSSDVLFKNVYCVIDFVLLSDYFGTAPFYWEVGINNCVVVNWDGTMSVASRSLFDTYRSRTFSTDFSAIIEKVIRFDVGDNNVFYLLSE